jgi:hypothetical protein
MTSTLAPAWISAGSTAPASREHRSHRQLTQRVGNSLEQAGLILVDRARCDQDERLTALALPFGLNSPVRIVELWPDISNIVWKLRCCEIK